MHLEEVARAIAFLPELEAMDREDEAVTLALVYIDRLAQKLEWPTRSSGRRFVNALLKFGGDDLVGLYHRRALYEGLRKRGGAFAAIADEHDVLLAGREQSLYNETDFLSVLRSEFTTDELTATMPELWRGT